MTKRLDDFLPPRWARLLQASGAPPPRRQDKCEAKLGHPPLVRKRAWIDRRDSTPRSRPIQYIDDDGKHHRASTSTSAKRHRPSGCA